MINLLETANNQKIMDAYKSIKMDAATVNQIVANSLKTLREGRVREKKSCITLPESDLGDHGKQEDLVAFLRQERLNWKLNALLSTNERYGVVKIVGSNACNKLYGQPRSQSTIMLLDKFTMRPLMIVDGTDLSALRTAAYASRVIDLFLKGTRMNVFIFGAGNIAERLIQALAAKQGGHIETLWLKGRTSGNAEKLRRDYSDQAPFAIKTCENLSVVRQCQLVITASNAPAPLYCLGSLHPEVTVLHLGGDEAPTDYIEYTLGEGTVICDDIEAVSERGSQSLPLYFHKLGTSLSEQAAHYNILNLWDVDEAEASALLRPMLITCVGLPVLDLCVAAYLYEALETT